jgi:hypothetical protein
MEKSRVHFMAAVLLAGMFGTTASLAWGPEGHRAVGALALDHMNDNTRQLLHDIMGSEVRDELTQWCNWPDEYRPTEEGAWSAPYHYINMVPGESEYLRERDCPDGMCLTEAIAKYAAELGDSSLSDERRRQAFGWVCHLLGDIHQPLHAGFGHDRGGNEFAIQFGGEESNLHEFWDHTLIELRTDSWEELYRLVHEQPFVVEGGPWQASEAIDWTNRSHALAECRAYPENPEISEEFAQSTWSMILAQLARGGVNLTRVLDTVLTMDSAQERPCPPGR